MRAKDPAQPAITGADDTDIPILARAAGRAGLRFARAKFASTSCAAGQYRVSGPVIVVTCELPDPLPITARELDALERAFGSMLDGLIGVGDE